MVLFWECWLIWGVGIFLNKILCETYWVFKMLFRYLSFIILNSGLKCILKKYIHVGILIWILSCVWYLEFLYFWKGKRFSNFLWVFLVFWFRTWDIYIILVRNLLRFHLDSVRVLFCIYFVLMACFGLKLITMHFIFYFLFKVYNIF